MSDPRTDPGNPGPSGWQPSYPPAPSPARPPQAGPYQDPPPAGAPQQAWPGWQGPPPNQAYPPGQAGDDRPGPGGAGPKQRSATRTQFALGAGIGFVVALAVVGVLLLTHVLSLGSSTADSATAADTRPITMPDTLGGLRTTVAVTTDKAGADRAQSLEERNGRTIDLTVKSYQQAYGGAAVGVQMYANDELLFLGTGIAVRAQAPGLTTGPVPDPADLKLAQNQQEVVAVDDVQCLVYHTRTTVEGQTPDPSDDVTGLCQRTGPDGTAQIFGQGKSDSDSVSQADMAKMADELYALLGTG